MIDGRLRLKSLEGKPKSMTITLRVPGPEPSIESEASWNGVTLPVTPGGNAQTYVYYDRRFYQLNTLEPGVFALYLAVWPEHVPPNTMVLTLDKDTPFHKFEGTV